MLHGKIIVMSAEALKRKVAEAALDYVKAGDVVGVGTGSTVGYFITALTSLHGRIDGAVASSVATGEALTKNGIRVLNLNETGTLPLYVDGADEADRHLNLIKGGGGALTREKIIAQASRQFVCIADESKIKDHLGAFPLPIEVIPMARGYVAREMIKLGGSPQWREDCVTDNGNIIVDVAGLNLSDPVAVEQHLNNIPGIVAVGLFSLRKADVLILAGESGITTLQRS